MNVVPVRRQKLEEKIQDYRGRKPMIIIYREHSHLLGHIFIAGFADEGERQYKNISPTITQRS